MPFIKKFIQNLTPSKKAKDLLLKEVRLEWKAVVHILEEKIQDYLGFSAQVSSQLVLLGGSNNLGFIEHRIDSIEEVFLTKIAKWDKLERELNFLDWHHLNVSEEQAFSNELIAYGLLNKETEIGFIIMPKLQPVAQVTKEKIYDLWLKSQLGLKFYDDSKAQFIELEGSTRIKDILNNVVCNRDVLSALNYLDDFFDKRALALKGFKEEIEFIRFHVKKSYQYLFNPDGFGFVHGDFKQANMLNTANNAFVLIDFQYYGKGYKEWDLAFFLSKQKKYFEESFSFFSEQFNNEEQVRRLALFYILALLLHPKPDKFKRLYRKNVLFAIDYLKGHLD